MHCLSVNNSWCRLLPIVLWRYAELVVLLLFYSGRVIRTRKFLRVCDEPVRVLTGFNQYYYINTC